MREKAEAKTKAAAGGSSAGPVANAPPKKPASQMSLAEQLQDQQRVMREKAEAKTKAAAAGDSGSNAGVAAKAPPRKPVAQMSFAE